MVGTHTEDIFTDRIFPVGETVGLGQITVGQSEYSDLGYGEYFRQELLDPKINIGEINNRIDSLKVQLAEIGIHEDSPNYQSYIGSAYNNQAALGTETDYGKRVQAYYNDVRGKKILYPETRIQSLVKKIGTRLTRFSKLLKSYKSRSKE